MPIEPKSITLILPYHKVSPTECACVGGEPGNLGRNQKRTLTLLYFLKFCNFAMVYVLGGQDFENGIFDPISCSKSADRSAV